MANIKFFRNVASYWNGTNHIPQEGYVWFNTEDRTINLYKNGAWEAYSGIKSASYTNNKLVITPCTGNAIEVDLSDMASASTLSTLSSSFNQLQTNFNALSGEFNTEKGKVSTLEGKMNTVETEVKKLEGITDKVTTYVVAKIGEVETAYQATDTALSNRIGTLETANTTNTTAISDLKTFVGFSGGVNVATQISNAINALDNGGVKGDGTYVDVTVTQTDGKVTTVAVSETGLTNKFNEVVKSVSDEVTRATNSEANLQTAINTEKGRVDKLVGSDTNKSVRTIAAEETAKIVDGADSSYDTLKEIAIWIAAHPGSVAELNKAIADNATAISNLTGDVNDLKKIDHDAYKAADTTTLNSAKSYADTKASTAETNAKAYTDALKNGQVNTNATNISKNEEDISTIKGQITTINTTIEENEETVAAALTDLDTRINSLASGTVSSVTGQGYISATTTNGAVVVTATTGAVANGGDTLAVASDVKSYVDSYVNNM